MKQSIFIVFGSVLLVLLFSFFTRLTVVSATDETSGENVSEDISKDTELEPEKSIDEILEVDSTPTEEVISQEILDYELPYPGILPDHPLYKLKLLRDRLLDFLIKDSTDRIEFNILMADKRLNMGIRLSDKKEYELAEETVSKGEKYFVKSVDELYSARNQGKDIPEDLLKRLLLSIQKHRIVIDKLKKQSPENVKAGFESSLQTISESHGRIVEFGM